MVKKCFILISIITLMSSSLNAQTYERYKKLNDTIIQSKNLGYEKKFSIIVPKEWQKETNIHFPLIIVFDRQNQRSNNFIIHTIDYLTSTEQMPSSVIINIESEQRYRYLETQYKTSDPNGLAFENEKFVFEELIPLVEKEYFASDFRLFIGHSRYGYFTTSLFNTHIKDLSGVIAISPFFTQKNVDLTDSIKKLNVGDYKSNKYLRFGIGNDFPDDYKKMDSVISQNIQNSFLNIKGLLLKKADHNATPGLIISNALYEIFEDWSAIQSNYLSKNINNMEGMPSIDKEIFSKYGVKINLSLGVLNGKGWYYYNEGQYDKAIQAWEILMDVYPNFSEGYLYIIDAQIHLKHDYNKTIKKFTKSLSYSEFYSEKEKKELELEMQEIIK